MLLLSNQMSVKSPHQAPYYVKLQSWQTSQLGHHGDSCGPFSLIKPVFVYNSWTPFVVCFLQTNLPDLQFWNNLLLPLTSLQFLQCKQHKTATKPIKLIGKKTRHILLSPCAKLAQKSYLQLNQEGFCRTDFRI